ncbi:L,D-transpeptidase [Streptomyces zingiberis]|uniref:L,D-transpeptidase n=1 Tax=Streptomyces zingiberis TaxID=2053010 RepID=A0ABX1BWT4_9ACTN|nr:Ig-like domain-containing protein [Streptomyces zingiberis]NJP99768.1 L,D-transpeptidase [Streptomyces zingiberis]
MTPLTRAQHHGTRIRTVLGSGLLIGGLVTGAAACGGSGHPLSAKPYDATGQIAFSGDGDGDAERALDPDRPLELTAKSGGRITDVTAGDTAGHRIRGELSEDGSRWRSTSRLAAGVRYTLRVSTEDGDGAPGLRVIDFRTASAERRLRVTFGPEKGTYGVGQPITAELSRPVKDRAARARVESSLRVSSRPAVSGAWHWVDDKTLHYRPRAFWPARATIEARSTLDGVDTGRGSRGGASKPLRIRTGPRVEVVTDARNHTLTLRRDGKVVKTVPVTTGKPGFETRNGTKIVLAKEPFVRMRSTTVGIAAGSSESYDLPVQWAVRLTWSGEYVHAAPWSVGSHGSANVSHGCTGMSMENAKWFFDAVRPGDIVRVVGSEGEDMTPFDNGFGDWNLTWAKWSEGSALRGPVRRQQAGPAQPARLRPQL